MTFRLIITACLFGLLLASCTKTDDFAPNEISPDLFADLPQDPLDGSTTSIVTATEAELRSFFAGQAQGYEAIRLVTEQRLDGTEEQLYLIDGDMTLNAEQYKAFQQELEDGQEKQYSTNNLVTQSSNTISVYGYYSSSNPNSTSSLRSNQRTGLRYAVNNWNAVSTRFNFTLTFGTSWQSSDIVVYRQVNSSPGGRADFPSGGKPGRFVRIYSGLDNSNTQVNEHVACHEIGHAMGLRHTNYYSREGCSNPGNEGAGSVGANHIPGTPTGDDDDSLMNACYPSNTDGEFSANDRIAIEYLY